MIYLERIKMQLNDYFETSDFALVTTLLCLGFTLDCLDRTNTPKVTFIFKRSKELEDTIQAFWNSQLKVNPKAFFNTQKELKARMYSSD